MHGAGRPKSHAFHHSDPFLVVFFFRSLIFCFDFLFQLRLTCALTQDAPDCSSRQSMELSTCEGGSARSRSRSPEATSHQAPTTHAVVVAGCDEMAMTPNIMDSQLDANCSACSTASRWTPHTCKKARGVNKRHATPAGVVLRTNRSSVSAALGFRAPHHAVTSVDDVSAAGVYALMACEGFHQGEGSASAIGSLTDVRYLRPVERHVPSAPHHPSSSQEPPPPTRPPSPVLSPTFEQRDPADLDGVVVMAEDASLAPAMHVANEVQLDVAPSASQVTSANEPKEYLYPPPEGTFICVALREGVLPPELIVFTSDGGCIVVTHVEARRLSLQARDDEPSWSCGTCGRGPFARARAFACVHCMTCAPMAEDELRRLKEQRRHDGCAQPTRTHSVFYECRCSPANTRLILSLSNPAQGGARLQVPAPAHSRCSRAVVDSRGRTRIVQFGGDHERRS